MEVFETIRGMQKQENTSKTNQKGPPKLTDYYLISSFLVHYLATRVYFFERFKLLNLQVNNVNSRPGPRYRLYQQTDRQTETQAENLDKKIEEKSNRSF